MSISRNPHDIVTDNPQLKNYQRFNGCLIDSLSEKAFKCIAVNQTCQCIYVGSLEITSANPLLYNVDDLLFRKEPQIEEKQLIMLVMSV